MNIANHMVRAGLAFGDRPAIAEGVIEKYDYRTLASRVSRLAGALTNELGAIKGDRVALVLSNCSQYIEILYACWHAGLIVVPINAKLHSTDFIYMLNKSGAVICFTSANVIENLQSAEKCQVQHFFEVGSEAYIQLFQYEAMEPVHCEERDSAWIFYTSGTTGRPKGAVLTHRNLSAMSKCYFTDVDLGSPWEAILHAAPMSHGSGLYALAHVIQGSCHVIASSGAFDPAEIFQLIEHWPNIVLFAAPTMVKRLVEFSGDVNTANLKTIIYGGGPMYVDDLLAGIDRFGPKFSQLYGQGESPMTITAMSMAFHADKKHPRWLKRLASVGIPQTGIEVKIVGEDATQLSVGEVGEIVVRGDTVMSRYWTDTQASESALQGGWLFTGDYGFFDGDGFLTLKGRANDVIISGGTNIYPREVEEVLVRHPSIFEVSIIGRKDREWGEIVIAYIVLTNKHTLDLETLDQYCIDKMARFKRPRYYRIVDLLPKNSYGKILKTELQSREALILDNI